MNERWQRVQELFEAAVEREPEAQAAFLAASCGDDPALAAEVMALVRADVMAGSFIEEAVRRGSDFLAPEPDPIEVLGRVGKYEILGRIGEGGFGVVFKGRDPVLQRYVAVKTCSSRDEKLRRRFFREGQIAASLQHPNITTVHDLGVEAGIPYLVQEFLAGEDLNRKIARREPLGTVMKLDVLLQIARGLEYAHSKEVLHRDVKPANVRVLPSGGVKIMDFGIAKLLHEASDLTSRGVTVGTVGYLAPELLRGDAVDRRSDIFAYGVLAYELLTYQRPFKGTSFSEISYRVLSEEPLPLLELLPGIHPAVAAVVNVCLAKDPDRRHASFTEVLAILEPVSKTLRSGVRPSLPRLPLEPPVLGASTASRAAAGGWGDATAPSEHLDPLPAGEATGIDLPTSPLTREGRAPGGGEPE
ncbi:MAG: serine/threonine protein kinase, partial [Acidobacteriota bacterium]|nr:serine/threonine protein kinase [Acidobacteriota bacterium]